MLRVRVLCWEHPDGGWVAEIRVNGKRFGARNGFGDVRRDALHSLIETLVFWQ